MLNYLDWRTPCDIAFGVFMVTWLLARHACYLLVCWSIWAHVPDIMSYGCFTFASADPTVPGTRIPGRHDSAIWRYIFHPFTRPDGDICFSDNIRLAFLGLLLALQVLTLIWFTMIVKVAYGVLMGKGAEDSRSDDEASDVADEEEVEVEGPAYELVGEPRKPAVHAFDGGPAFIEEEVGADGLYQVKRNSAPVTRSRSRRTGGRASGISIPGHGDHKELLGRIGCDKPN